MIRIVTYSTKARGGVAHALALAEALSLRGNAVELCALSVDGARFFRRPEVPTRLVPVHRDPDEDTETRILRYADALADALRDAEPARISHAEDCLSARSLLRLRAEGRVPAVVRTIHHVDDFESPVLARCQRASIVDVDLRISVSRHWAEEARREFGVASHVVPNAVDAERYAACPLDRAAAGERMGWPGRTVVLSVGGVEPRKGTLTLLAAFAAARGRLGPRPLLAIAGGETLFDYSDYRRTFAEDAARLGLSVRAGHRPSPDADVAVLGAIADPEMPTLYRAADVLAFPSTREGFGLVVLEALASGLPAVVSDLPVFTEFLTFGRDCLAVPVGDTTALGDALIRAVGDRSLVSAGRRTAARHTWDAVAEGHERVYEELHARV